MSLDQSVSSDMQSSLKDFRLSSTRMNSLSLVNFPDKYSVMVG